MQESINIIKQIGQIRNTLIDLKKSVCIYKNLVLLFENNQIITALRIMILTYEMTMNERFNMIGLSENISRILLVILVNFSLASILVRL